MLLFEYVSFVKDTLSDSEYILKGLFILKLIMSPFLEKLENLILSAKSILLFVEIVKTLSFFSIVKFI